MEFTTTYRWDAGGQAPWGPAQCRARVSHVEVRGFVSVRDTGGMLGLNLSISKCEKWTHTMQFCGVPDFNVIGEIYEQ